MSAPHRRRTSEKLHCFHKVAPYFSNPQCGVKCGAPKAESSNARRHNWAVEMQMRGPPNRNNCRAKRKISIVKKTRPLCGALKKGDYPIRRIAHMVEKRAFFSQFLLDCVVRFRKSAASGAKAEQRKNAKARRQILRSNAIKSGRWRNRTLLANAPPRSKPVFAAKNGSCRKKNARYARAFILCKIRTGISGRYPLRLRLRECGAPRLRGR